MWYYIVLCCAGVNSECWTLLARSLSSTIGLGSQQSFQRWKMWDRNGETGIWIPDKFSLYIVSMEVETNLIGMGELESEYQINSHYNCKYGGWHKLNRNRETGIWISDKLSLCIVSMEVDTNGIGIGGLESESQTNSLYAVSMEVEIHHIILLINITM